MKGTWLPPQTEDNETFLHQTEALITTPLERALWQRLAEEAGLEHLEYEGNYEGCSRRELVSMLLNIEDQLGEDRTLNLINR